LAALEIGMAGSTSWGIEVGSAAVKAIKLSRTGDVVEILDFVIIPHKRVLVAPEVDMGEQVVAVREAIARLTNDYDLEGSQVCLSVPGHSAFARFAKLPPVEPKQIPKIVQFEAAQQIPFPIGEVEWDYQVFKTPDSPEVEVGIFAITRERVNERLSLWQELGVSPDVITLSPVAAYNAIAYDQNFSDKTPGTVIVDVGTTSTDLIVSEPGRMWIRTFPLGGHQFTDALVGAFKLGYAKAERLKCEAESSQHAKHVLQAMRPVFSDLVTEVQRSIGYYQSLHRDANLTRLVALGSTFQLPGLRKYLSQQLQMEVTRPESFNALKVEGPRGAEFAAAVPTMATAYGLALQGLGLEACRPNLMPVAIARQSMWKRKRKWFAAAAVIAVVGAAIPFATWALEKNKVESMTKPPEIEQVKNDLRNLRANWTNATKDWKDDPRAANALILLERRDIVPNLVDDLGQMMAKSQQIAQQRGKSATQKAGFNLERYEMKFYFGASEIESDQIVDSNPARSNGRRKKPRSGDGALSPAVNTGAGTNTASGTPGAPGAPGAPVEPAAVSDGRMKITMVLTTTMPEAEKYITETVEAWLRANANRPGVPYVIKVAGDDIGPNMNMSSRVWDKFGAPVVVAADGTAPKMDTDDEDEDGQPKAPVLDPKTGLPSDKRTDAELKLLEQSERDNIKLDGGLNDMAPLPASLPVGYAGETITKFVVVFEAWVKTKAPGGSV
jgi:type IV pilus assembly protein PilM